MAQVDYGLLIIWIEIISHFYWRPAWASYNHADAKPPTPGRRASKL